jgi:hypothetical protein
VARGGPCASTFFTLYIYYSTLTQKKQPYFFYFLFYLEVGIGSPTCYNVCMSKTTNTEITIHSVAQDACNILWAVCEDYDLRMAVLSALNGMQGDYGDDVATPANAFIKFMHDWNNNESYKTNYETWLGDYV